ncbi:MAG: hypothetical protein ACLGG0_01935 [Bacteriovoracia bacterium]
MNVNYLDFFDLKLIKELRNKIKRKESHFKPIEAKFGFNLPLSLLNGIEIRKNFPEIVSFAETNIKELVEREVGTPINLMRDNLRSIRIQRYTSPKEGFLWHIDGADYTVFITLSNTLKGGTEYISFKRSLLLKPLVYFYPFLVLFNRCSWAIRPFAPRRMLGEPGDLILLQGGKSAHRTYCESESGERQILAISFDRVTKPKNPIWDFIAQKLVHQ